MRKNSTSIHRLNPVILNRDEVVNYIKLRNHQYFIIAPCGSDLACNSSRSKSAKSFISERQMLATVKQLTLITTSWLTAHDLNKIRMSNSSDSLEHPGDWIVSKRAFTVEIAEQEFFPFYALDPEQNLCPYTILAEIIKIFAEQKDSWGMAFWFSTVSGFLGGQRPKDLLKARPEMVLAAAIDEVAGTTHG